MQHHEEIGAAVATCHRTAAPDRHDGRPGPAVLVVAPQSPRGVIWLWLQEDLDLATVERARTELESVVDGSPTPGYVLVYLGAGRFVGLHGLRVLVQSAHRARSRRVTLLVVGPSTSVRVLVEHVGCVDELPTAPTAGAAMRRARPDA